MKRCDQVGVEYGWPSSFGLDRIGRVLVSPTKSCGIQEELRRRVLALKRALVVFGWRCFDRRREVLGDIVDVGWKLRVIDGIMHPCIFLDDWMTIVSIEVC